MSIIDILVYPHAQLTQVSREVEQFDAQLQQVVTNLIDTMAAAPGCVGIAAPQIGYAMRVVMVDVSSKPDIKHHGRLILVNPENLHWEGFAVGREGCLSVPDFTGNVVRAERITLEAYDPTGQRQEYTLEGYEARAVQHEIDHLDGTLFLDRLVSRRSDLFKRKKYQGKPKTENPK